MSTEVRAAECTLSSMVRRAGEVVESLHTEERLRPLCSRDKVDGWKCKDAWCYW